MSILKRIRIIKCTNSAVKATKLGYFDYPLATNDIPKTIRTRPTSFTADIGSLKKTIEPNATRINVMLIKTG
jgi:hypothetical protein